MNLRPILIAGAMALALVSCGKKEAGARETKSSAAAARVEAASPLDAPYRVKDARPIDVDALFSLLPASVRASYDSAKFDAKLGATVVANLRLVDQDAGDETEFDGLAIDRAELYGVDMEAIERVKAAEAAGLDAPFEKVFDKVRLFGVKPADPQEDGEASIGAAEFDQFRLRQGGFKDGGEDDNPAFFFNAFDLAGLYLKGVAIDADAKDSGAFAFKAPDLRFVGLGGGKLGAVIANDFEYEVTQSAEAREALMQTMGPAGAILSGPLKGFIAPDHQRVTVKSFEWRDIDLSGLMGYGLKKEKPPLTARDLLNLGTLKISGAETYIDGRLAAKAAESRIDAFEFTWLVPSKIRSTSTGAEYDFTAYITPEEEEAIAILKKHGLDSVKGEGTLSWDWDAQKGDAAFKTDFKTTNLADFKTDLSLAGLELEKVNALLEAEDANPIVKAGAFKGFGLTLVDKTLLDAIFDMSALEMGGSGADLRQSTPAIIRLSGMQAASLNPRIADYVEAVANFIAMGGTIEIAARPKAPVPLAAIEATGESGPEVLPDLLDLKVTHTKKK